MARTRGAGTKTRSDSKPDYTGKQKKESTIATTNGVTKSQAKPKAKKAAAATTTTNGSAKPRGRPPGTDKVKITGTSTTKTKKTTAPKKAAAPKMATTKAVTGERRGRGRPAKSPAAQAQFENALSEEVAKNPKEKAKPAPKGRPRKDPASASEEKPKPASRGRPKKELATASEEKPKLGSKGRSKKETEKVEEVEKPKPASKGKEKKTETVEEAEKPKPTSRGRRKKAATTEAVPEKKEAKPRGRPKRQPEADEEEEEEPEEKLEKKPKSKATPKATPKAKSTPKSTKKGAGKSVATAPVTAEKKEEPPVKTPAKSPRQKKETTKTPVTKSPKKPTPAKATATPKSAGKRKAEEEIEKSEEEPATKPLAKRAASIGPVSSKAPVKSTPHKRARTEEPSVPISSFVVEKGIAWFFVRPKVTLEGNEPKSFDDIQRSYVVLRPLPLKQGLTNGGPIGDSQGESKKEGEPTVKNDEGTLRVIEIPKKKWPGSGARLLTFVGKTHATIDQVKNEVLHSSHYSTKTLGERTTPAALPIATAVYAISKAEKTTHFAYALVHSDPSSGLTPIQAEMGLHAKGSNIVTVKNPKFPSPPGVGISADPGYSDEIKKQFEDYRWIPLSPRHLDYQNAELLFIGEKHSPGSGDEALVASGEVLEQLAKEDEDRIQELSKGKHDDDGIFKDLELGKEEWGDVIMTDWKN